VLACTWSTWSAVSNRTSRAGVRGFHFVFCFMHVPTDAVGGLSREIKERKRKPTPQAQGRDGRTRRHHTGISREGRCVASRRPPLGVCLFLDLSSRSLTDSPCNRVDAFFERKKKRTTQGRDGRTARRHHTEMLSSLRGACTP